METASLRNSTYFIQTLYKSGIKLEAIANGSRLSPDLIKNILLNKPYALDERQFSQLLGFYCYYLCKVRDNSQQADRLQQFKELFQKSAQQAQSNVLLNYLKIKPWLEKKACVLKHSSGKKSYLTRREQEVLYYLLQDFTQAEAAGKLNISKRTIEYHWGRIRNRLNAMTPKQILQYWHVMQD